MFIAFTLHTKLEHDVPPESSWAQQQTNQQKPSLMFHNHSSSLQFVLTGRKNTKQGFTFTHLETIPICNKVFRIYRIQKPNVMLRYILIWGQLAPISRQVSIRMYKVWVCVCLFNLPLISKDSIRFSVFGVSIEINIIFIKIIIIIEQFWASNALSFDEFSVASVLIG